MTSESDGLNKEPLITKVKPRSVEIKRDQTQLPMQHSRISNLEPLPILSEQQESQSSIFDTIADTAKAAWLYMRLVPYFIKLIGGLVMRDWKTTSTAVLGGIAAIINYATGFVVPQGVIEFVTMILGFYFAADGKGQAND